MVLVGQQREAQAVLLVEAGLACGRVGADAHDGRVPHLVGDVPQAASLLGASRRVGLGIEVDQMGRLPPLGRFGEVELLSVLVQQGEVGGLVTWL